MSAGIAIDPDKPLPAGRLTLTLRPDDGTQASWDASLARWLLLTSRGELTADVLISAAGPLSEPSLPDIPGLATFPGEIFHSARWNHGYDLKGKRVAVVAPEPPRSRSCPRSSPQSAAWCSSSEPRPGSCPAGTAGSAARRSGSTGTFR